MQYILLFALFLRSYGNVEQGLLPRILPLGDSITFGCGSSAQPPNWTVGCTPDCGGYRSHLYHILRDTGWADVNGTATFQFVGSGGFAGPIDVPMSQRAHEGHPGWTINKIINIARNWIETAPNYILIHLGTSECSACHPNQVKKKSSSHPLKYPPIVTLGR